MGIGTREREASVRAGSHGAPSSQIHSGPLSPGAVPRPCNRHNSVIALVRVRGRRSTAWTPQSRRRRPYFAPARPYFAPPERCEVCKVCKVWRPAAAHAVPRDPDDLRPGIAPTARCPRWPPGLAACNYPWPPGPPARRRTAPDPLTNAHASAFPPCVRSRIHELHELRARLGSRCRRSAGGHDSCVRDIVSHFAGPSPRTCRRRPCLAWNTGAWLVRSMRSMRDMDRMMRTGLWCVSRAIHAKHHEHRRPKWTGPPIGRWERRNPCLHDIRGRTRTVRIRHRRPCVARNPRVWLVQNMQSMQTMEVNGRAATTGRASGSGPVRIRGRRDGRAGPEPPNPRAAVFQESGWLEL
jgi:hypothetical protein